MTFDEMRTAMRDAREKLRMTDAIVGELAEMLVGRLRHGVDGGTLARLKAELADFNRNTRRWKK